MYIYVCIYMCVWVFICVCICVYGYACLCVYVCVCMYICMYGGVGCMCVAVVLSSALPTYFAPRVQDSGISYHCFVPLGRSRCPDCGLRTSAKYFPLSPTSYSSQNPWRRQAKDSQGVAEACVQLGHLGNRALVTLWVSSVHGGRSQTLHESALLWTEGAGWGSRKCWPLGLFLQFRSLEPLLSQPAQGLYALHKPRSHFTLLRRAASSAPFIKAPPPPSFLFCPLRHHLAMYSCLARYSLCSSCWPWTWDNPFAAAPTICHCPRINGALLWLVWVTGSWALRKIWLHLISCFFFFFVFFVFCFFLSPSSSPKKLRLLNQELC
jgi:hypothetical protein